MAFHFMAATGAKHTQLPSRSLSRRPSLRKGKAVESLNADETHPEGMTVIVFLAPIVRVQSQVSPQTGGGAPLTTG